MSRELIIKPGAELDLRQAHRWYEDQRVGLGQELLDEVDVTLNRIRKNPKSGTPAYRDSRLALTRRFPYVICYVFNEQTLFVLAIFHGHRDPGV